MIFCLIWYIEAWAFSLFVFSSIIILHKYMIVVFLLLSYFVQIHALTSNHYYSSHADTRWNKLYSMAIEFDNYTGFFFWLKHVGFSESISFLTVRKYIWRNISG